MKTIVTLLAILLCGSAFAAKPYNMQSIVLLQPDFVLSERAQVSDLSSYIKSVTAAADTTLSGIAKPVPASGFIVVAVRPGGQSKVWLDFSPALPAAVAVQLRSSLEQVVPFQAKGGVVVFALNSSLWGATPTTRPMPSPTEWNEAMKSSDSPVEIGELIERLWPQAGT